MSKILSWHNGMESDSVNAPINVTSGLQVGGLSFPSLSGTAYFVDSTSTAGSGANGKTKATAFTTVAAALLAAVSHDVIFIFPGTYAENLTVSSDYITLVGMQSGYGRPDVAPATGVVLTVEAQGFVCKRVRFASGDGSSCVRQKGNGFVFADCVFDDATDAGAAGVLLKGNDDDDSYTASEGVISNCLFRGNASGIVFAGAETPGNGVGSTHCVIDSCRFIDNTGPDLATADNDSTDATYSVQDVVIQDCDFAEPKNKATWVDFTTANGGAASAQTGMIRNCYFNDDTVDTTAIAIVGTGVGVVGCHSMDGEFDGSGLD